VPGESLLQPLAVEQPDASMFPLPQQARHLPPFGTEVQGAKATNKFWANWVVEEGRELFLERNAENGTTTLFSFKKDPKISQDEQINRSETQVSFGGLFDMTGKAFKSVLR
jgi:hypothetical protein